MISNELNPQQQEVANTLTGALLVIAGAGTGKTHVIVSRIANMVRSGIPGPSILAVTFTNKAAKEMQERVAARCGLNSREAPTVSTFHSFCLGVLHQFIHLLGYSNNFTIATEGYQKGLLREIAVELGLASNNVDPYTWLARISLAKAYLETPEDMAKQNIKDGARIAQIYQRYQERLARMNMVDFDDLLVLTVRLWETHPQLLQGYQERYRYFMVDEYQDTNRVQLKLIQLLASREGNICAVGDDDQSIYGWRGASQENIRDFEIFFPGAKVIHLEENYRSTNNILSAANAVIARNKNRHEKNLWSARGDGELLTLLTFDDVQAEADFIADIIYNNSMVGNSLTMGERNWNRFAILYRASALSRQLEASLRRRHIPYMVVGSNSFYKRKEILDILTMLELVLNPDNDMALMRVINVPPRGVGDASLDKLIEKSQITHQHLLDLASSSQYLEMLQPESAQLLREFIQAIFVCRAATAEPGPIYSAVTEFLRRIHYEEKLFQMYKPREDAYQRQENVHEFLTSVAEYDLSHHSKGTLKEFVMHLALQDANDRVEKEKEVTANAVVLMTIHASKGLEFPVVFLPGLEENTFPHERALKEGGEEEERRLFYVALTRAKEQLYITHCTKRPVMNTVKIRRISRFLMEIPDKYCKFTKPQEIQQGTSQEEAEDYLNQIMMALKK